MVAAELAFLGGKNTVERFFSVSRKVSGTPGVPRTTRQDTSTKVRDLLLFF